MKLVLEVRMLAEDLLDARPAKVEGMLAEHLDEVSRHRTDGPVIGDCLLVVGSGTQG